MRRSPVQVRQGAFFYFPETFPEIFLRTIIKIRIIIKKRKPEALIKIHKKSNPCVIKHTNMSFLIRPKNRKAEIYYKRKCDVGASKNAGQAFSTPRLSSHCIIYEISAFLLFGSEGN